MKCTKLQGLYEETIKYSEMNPVYQALRMSCMLKNSTAQCKMYNEEYEVTECFLHPIDTGHYLSNVWFWKCSNDKLKV